MISLRRVLSTAGRVLLVPAGCLGFAGATIGLTPAPDGTGATAVPSPATSALYVLLQTFPTIVPVPRDRAELAEIRRRDEIEPPQVPARATWEVVDSGRVRSEWICDRTATKDRAILHLHGGGFMAGLDNGPRRAAATMSRLTKACVLVVDYRLAPEHPYPAGRDDSVTAYRWLLKQVGDARKLAIMGDSAGGNLTLSTALVLRRDGDPLPAALVSVSGAPDLTLTGETFRTLADRDPLLNPGNRALVRSAYLRDSRIDARDPLVSPLYADPAGLPPTLLLVGSQEVLLSDTLALGDRFRAAKVPVEVQVWPGQVHTWPLVIEEAPESVQANRQTARFILQAWSSLR